MPDTSTSPLPQFISEHVLDGEYFFLDLSQKDREGCVVACGGNEQCSADYQVEREGFRFIGVEFVVSGKARLKIKGEEFELTPGCLFGYLPETEMLIESVGKQPLQKYFVDFSGDFAVSLFKKSPLGNYRPCRLPGTRWVSQVFQQLVHFGKAGGEAGQRSCNLLVEHLLLQVGEEARSILSEERDSVAYQTYARCREYMEINYAKLTSASDLATATHVDKAYLSRLFKRFDEETPYKKIVRLKMNLAATLLMRGGASVKEVAHAVGMDDPFHFSRLFKQAYGVAPRYFTMSVSRGV